MASAQDRSKQARHRSVAVAGAAALVFLAGMAARGAVDDRPPEAAPSVLVEEAARSLGPGPTREVNGAPAGFAHTRDGARSAAVSFTATLSQRLLYLEPAEVDAAVTAAAAEASAHTLAADAATALTAAREPLGSGGGTTWWVVAPLATKVEAYALDRARVSVWLVRVLSQPGVVVPQSSWVTETVELVWERGDWHLWADDSAAGPTPVLDGSDLPASAGELDSALSGFELVDQARTEPE